MASLFAEHADVSGRDRFRFETAVVEVLANIVEPAGVDLSAVMMPGEEAESGRGLALALAAVDDLEYRNVEGRNYWDLRCHRES